MKGLLLAVLLAVASLPAKADVYTLIGARLAVMEDVAAWKDARGVPVEDKEREKVVLEAAGERAAAEGLDRSLATAFFAAQIEAAKDIQRCAIARWEQGEAERPTNPPDLKSEIRPRLITLGAEILDAIAGTLRTGGRVDDRARFDEALAPHCIEAATRETLFAELSALALAD
ncbi:MAG: gamma subclass chorismate mutase AroQ [Pseudomonadota bacterium]